ncbi:unnamed protein product, partial [Symbiodinium sp. CCMP2456]
MVAPKSRKPWQLLVSGLAGCMECMHMLWVFVPSRVHEKQPVQTRLAADGRTRGRKTFELPPLTSPANPAEHVFIPLENYSEKIEELFQEEEFLFIRGGVGVGKSTLGAHLGRESPKRFVSVSFGDGEYDSWCKNIVAGIVHATGLTVPKSDTQLEDALRLAKEHNLILVLDEAHTIFNVGRIVTLLFKSRDHPKVVFLSASGEVTGSTPTTPVEITQKYFWTPPIPDVDDDFVAQLAEAGVRLDQDSTDFFMNLCGGHRSIFMAAMKWAKEMQKGANWTYHDTVTNVRASIHASSNSWSTPGSILKGLAASRGVKVNGLFSNLDMTPMEFVTILCQGPGRLPQKLCRDLTVCGFVQPVPIEAGSGEFRRIDWTSDDVVYMVANPILATYYRNRLESSRGLTVTVHPFIPANCMDLLLRAVPYLTFVQVVGYSPQAASSSALSTDELPFEDQYNAAIIESLTKLGYKTDSSHSPTVGKVDIFADIEDRSFSVECIMAKRRIDDHHEHRSRFDNPSTPAYSKADNKALVTIGRSKDLVRHRVSQTKADGVEIIGLVPNAAHTGYSILYRGAQATQGADLVEYNVECDLVARALDTNGRLHCIQKVSHIAQPQGQPTAPPTFTVWVRQLREDDSGTVSEDPEEAAFVIDSQEHKLDNVAYLKKAIKKEAELKGPANRLLIYAREGGGWKPLIDMEDAHLTRGSRKADCYGYLPPGA